MDGNAKRSPDSAPLQIKTDKSTSSMDDAFMEHDPGKAGRDAQAGARGHTNVP